MPSAHRPHARHWIGQLAVTTLTPILAFTLMGVLPCSADEASARESSRAPLLWRIGSENPSYLFGTIHIADPRVLALDDVVEDAFERADAVYTELPMDAATMMSSLGKMMLPDNKTLADVLPDDLYARTERYLESKGYSMQMFSGFKLWTLSASLTFLDAMKEMAFSEPLDLHLYSRASRAGKDVGGIETVDEQMDILESLSREEQIEFLVKTLDTLQNAEANGDDYLELLVEAYLRGDEDALVEFLFEFGDGDDPLVAKYLDRLLGERNRLMAERIEQKLTKRPAASMFFALGAGHMGGDAGLVALLRERGLEVERVMPTAAATATR